MIRIEQWTHSLSKNCGWGGNIRSKSLRKIFLSENANFADCVREGGYNQLDILPNLEVETWSHLWKSQLAVRTIAFPFYLVTNPDSYENEDFTKIPC